MSRTPWMSQLRRSLRIALHCEKEGISTSEGLERAAAQDRHRGVNRREFLAGIGKGAAAGALLGTLSPSPLFALPGGGSAPSIGIVGAGLAGLTCADTLKTAGYRTSVYEAAARTGGRCWSLRGFFPGQVCERGGELIDNLHKTMIGYAARYGLTLEDISKQPGEVFYYFNGTRYPESVVVDQWRAFVPALSADLRALSGDVTADNHTDTDVRIDNTSLLAFLDGQNGAGITAGPVLRQTLIQSYEAEYGLSAGEQSCLNLLMFIHADKRSKFTPFGVFSDERFHIVEGNDGIIQGLTRDLAGQIETNMSLIRVRKVSGGKTELTFKNGTKTVTRSHDAVVLSVPFTVLRNIELDGSLGLPAEKINAIRNLGYGTNAKMMVGFRGPVWRNLGSNGSSYANLPNVQATWETNPTKATAQNAILTDYSSAARGASLDPRNVQKEVSKFLGDLNQVFPGSLAAASKAAGNYVAHLEHWPSSPYVKGSYTCYKTGQFTSIAGIEGKPVGNLHFAGEHTNSFYEWQGFMEGGCLSGIQAANEILQDIKTGAL